MPLSLKLPEQVASVVRELAQAQGITATEVLRRGVALDKFVTEQLADGSALVLREADGSMGRVHLVW